MNSVEKGPVLLFEPVLVRLIRSGLLHVSSARPFDAMLDFGIHQNRQIGLNPAAQYPVQIQHGFASQLSPSALVDL